MATRTRRDDEPEPLAEEPAAEKARPVRAKAEPDPLAALIGGLEEIVPGFDVLDRELVFESGARADVAGVDPSGRLHLVLLAADDLDRATLEVLDAVGLLRSELELVARHLGEARVNVERAPRVLVVNPSSDTRLARRLAALADQGVAVLALRTVKSAGGERAYLVRVETDGRSAGGSGGVAAFLRALPGRLEALGNQLVERMGRLDEELVASADTTTIVWRLAGEVLCRVERVGDLLQASVAPAHEPLPLGDPSDLERLIEKALARLVRLLGLTRAERRPAENGEKKPGESEPILTAEEIQAFRD